MKCKNFIFMNSLFATAFMCAIIALGAILFTGCAGESVKYVYLPQKCDTPFPPAIKPSEDIVRNYGEILTRLEILEYKLHYCRGDEINGEN